jgi:hypothetical protein
MLKNKRVKIYVVLFEMNINFSNLYHKGVHNIMIVIKELVWGRGGECAKLFVNNQSLSNVVNLLDLKWANYIHKTLCFYLHCLNLS